MSDFDGNRDDRLDINEQMDQFEFQAGDVNRDGLVDSPEYGQGERTTKHRCMCFIHEYI
jgi:hypothetical protein